MTATAVAATDDNEDDDDNDDGQARVCVRVWEEGTDRGGEKERKKECSQELVKEAKIKGKKSLQRWKCYGYIGGFSEIS